MQAGSWNSIFTLLAATVIIDKKIYKEEVDCFIDSILDIHQKTDSDIAITKATVLDWFIQHRDAIEAIVKSHNHETKLLHYIMQLNNFEHRELVLEKMETIALSDNYEHFKEKDLTAIARAHWIPLQFN